MLYLLSSQRISSLLKRFITFAYVEFYKSGSAQCLDVVPEPKRSGYGSNCCTLMMALDEPLRNSSVIYQIYTYDKQN